MKSIKNPKGVVISLYVLISLSCCTKKKDISKEIFAGMRIGTLAKDYRREVSENKKFVHNINGDYYKFNPSPLKIFYGVPRATVNSDSVVIAMNLYVCTEEKHLLGVGKEEEWDSSQVYFNIRKDANGYLPAEEEIFNYLKHMLDRKYPIQSMNYEQLNEGKIDKHVLKYTIDNSIVITLDRIVNTDVYQGFNSRIKITYALSDKYLKDNKLNKFKSPNDL
ncbi:MAG: hypothetical protein ACTHMD_09520 [Flavisolibacter sp.]